MKSISKQWRAACFCALVVAAYACLAYDGAEATYRLWYYVPAAFVWGAWVVDRSQQRWASGVRIGIDSVVLLLCAARPLFGWPPASGHALFFVHVLLTAATTTTKRLAWMLGVITIYAKLWLWHDAVTLWPGLLLGVVTGLCYTASMARDKRD